MADEGQRFSGPALGSIAAGGLLVFAGIKGYSLSQMVTDIIRGKSPLQETNTLPITGTPSTAAGGSVVAAGQASSISADALKYQGAGYVWGGAPAKGIGNWDCSSFANWVCGHDVGLPIPGYAAGSYTGSSHGPVTGEWMVWSGLTTVGNNGSVAQAGDLAVWQTHMGICLGPNSMISAQNPSSGTQVSAINGFIPELLFIRRYTTGPGLSATGILGKQA
jgi:cell wall-associated NlpC family hydrolase